MKLTRILALLLAMALCLTACGSGTASTSSTGSADASADTSISASADDAVIPDEALEDVVSYLTDGAYKADDVIVTVGDVDVTAAEVLYWIAYQQYNLMYYNYLYYGSVSFSTSDDMGDGTTVGEYLVNLGIQTAIAYASATQKANEMGVSLSEENLAVLETLDEDNVTSYGEDRWQTYLDAGLIAEEDFTDEEKAAWIQTKGEEFYLHSMMYYATTAAGYHALINNVYFFSALQSALFDEGGEYEATAETMQDYMASYIDENGIIWGRCILFSTADCEDEDAVAEVKAQAQAAYDQLSGLSGDALSEAFTELQSEYDASGYTAGEIQYYSNTDSLVDGYYDGLAALQPGEIAMTDELGTSTTSYGFFILLREEDQTDDIYDTVESDYLSSTYDALIDQWMEEYVGEDVTMNFDVEEFFTRLNDLQTVLATVDTVSAAETAE
jgi:hypothetical protein